MKNENENHEHQFYKLKSISLQNLKEEMRIP